VKALFLAENGSDKDVISKSFGGIIPGVTFRYIVTTLDDT
jgi:hypothetical protein